jgi:predicted nucleic acid-binding protein
MNVVDSSCWLEFIKGTDIGAAVRPIISNPDELIVPTITLYEVYKKLLAEKGENYAMDVVTYMQTGAVIDLNAALCLSAAQISRLHKLPMADSIIYATSRSYSAVLWTCDKHFKDIPSIRYFPKPATPPYPSVLPVWTRVRRSKRLVEPVLP